MARTLTPFYYREEFVPALQEFVEEGPLVLYQVRTLGEVFGWWSRHVSPFAIKMTISSLSSSLSSSCLPFFDPINFTSIGHS